MRERGRRGVGTAVAASAAAVALLVVASGSAGTVLATPISSDPYTNPDSQHATQVEPDSFAFGNTVVVAIQTGRYVNGGGASNIAWATSTDAGRHWVTGMLPGTTVFAGGPWARISDPAVAYDPEHDVWMISSLVFGMASSPLGSPSAVLTSRSTDGGLTWQSPVTTSLGSTNFYDKNWITCDTWSSSPHYGNCYTEWDDFGQGGRLLMSTSTDGGLTWGPPTPPGGLPSGLGGQPVAQPNGTVVVPYSTGNEIRVFRSSDGGANWTSSTSISPVTDHGVAGGLRTSALPSAEVDGEGRVYVAWQDCRFRSGCPANDIVYSTLDGREHLVGRDASSDRPDHERRGPLHPRDRRRPGDLREQRPSRAHVLLLPGEQLHRRHVPAHRRLRLLARRRRDLDAADPRCRSDAPVVDRGHGSGADGRRLHLDLLYRRRERACRLRHRQASDGQRVLGARGERHLRSHCSAGGPEDSRGQGADVLPRAHASKQFEHSQFPLEETRAKG